MTGKAKEYQVVFIERNEGDSAGDAANLSAHAAYKVVVPEDQKGAWAAYIVGPSDPAIPSSVAGKNADDALGKALDALNAKYPPSRWERNVSPPLELLQ